MRNRMSSCARALMFGSIAAAGAIHCGNDTNRPSDSPGGSGTVVIGPGFPGAGATAGNPLLAGFGPSTARDCAGSTSPTSRPSQVSTQVTQCYYTTTTTTTSSPAASVEQILETVDGRKIVHLRIIFDPGFVDNSYGNNAIGWSSNNMPAGPGMPDSGKMPPPPKPGKGHTFDDLVGSDHVEVQMFDGAGGLALHFKVDYISADTSRPCGFGTLGVTGGEGKMIVGSPSSVLAVATSLDRDLNGCGYCLTVDSPATDSLYTPNSATPRWDYRVVYELWVDANAFGSAGYGDALIENVHASPSKADSNTIVVKKGTCPPTWPECKPDVVTEGLNCGDAGAGCPPGSIEYIKSEGRTCVPTPVPLPDGGLGCPAGYHLDLTTEGRYCLPD